MRKITTERIVLDKDEREIRKTWGNDWKRIMADMKKYGKTYILIGTWSGYNSAQSRVSHAEYVKNEHVKGLVLQTIVFTDGTTLNMSLVECDLARIFNWKVRRVPTYDHLVREARGTMQNTYYVGGRQEPVAAPQEPEKTTVEKIHEGEERENWYDKF